MHPKIVEIRKIYNDINNDAIEAFAWNK